MDPTQTFAGVKTALTFAESLAGVLHRDLQISPFAESLRQAISRSELGKQLRITPLRDLCSNRKDIWIATFWETAAALQVACAHGLLSPEQVVYLIQDYEPNFYGWSSESAIAESTYNSGFLHVVNSSPLAEYLLEQHSIQTDERFTIAPVLNTEALKSAAGVRTSSSSPRIFFYARPNKPRNLYAIGATALSLFSSMAADLGWKPKIITAGDLHPRLDVASSSAVDVRGNVGWAGYYDLLASSDIALTLMMSPHPSHPPLDCAISGIRTVTNSWLTYRDNLHQNIRTAPATPFDLSNKLIQACADWQLAPNLPYSTGPSLGRPLDEVVANVAERLS